MKKSILTFKFSDQTMSCSTSKCSSRPVDHRTELGTSLESHLVKKSLAEAEIWKVKKWKKRLLNFTFSTKLPHVTYQNDRLDVQITTLYHTHWIQVISWKKVDPKLKYEKPKNWKNWVFTLSYSDINTVMCNIKMTAFTCRWLLHKSIWDTFRIPWDITI